MTLARLLAAALVFCSLPAFAQDQKSQTSGPSSLCGEARPGCPVPGNIEIAGGEFFFFDSSHYKPAARAEPWRLIPDRLADVPSGYNALDPSRLDQYRFDHVKNDPQVSHLKLDTLDEDTTCFTIRSYVVARDSKGSDSTHPAGYSTCQPSNRFQVKSADVRVVSSDR
jgi:hypothetical protein